MVDCIVAFCSSPVNAKVKKLKTIHICQSYSKNKSGTFLWTTVYVCSARNASWVGYIGDNLLKIVFELQLCSRFLLPHLLGDIIFACVQDASAGIVTSHRYYHRHHSDGSTVAKVTLFYRPGSCVWKKSDTIVKSTQVWCRHP